MESLGSGEGLGVLGGWVSVGLGATFCGHGYRVWVLGVVCGCWGLVGGVFFCLGCGVWVSLGRLGWGVICV